MYPILFSIGRLNFYTHGLLIAIGALVGGIFVYFIAKKKGLETKALFDLIVYSLLGGLLGSRILYLIIYHNQFSSLKEVLYIWYGGLISFGGIIGGFVTAGAILAYRKKPVLEWFDIGIIGLLIGWAIGRVGCLLAGDSLGIPSALKIAIWGRIPTQLFESGWSILVAIFCYFLLVKKEKYQLPNGFILGSGLVLYSLGRFVIDFFRDDPIFLWGLKAGQWGALIIFLIVTFILATQFMRRNASLKERSYNDSSF